MGAPQQRTGAGKGSVKSDRSLRQLGVLERLNEGEALVAVGPVYVLAENDALARLAFARDGDTLCVGYAVQEAERWQPVELEPYSLRALGYWQRWLKRHGVELRAVQRRR